METRAFLATEAAVLAKILIFALITTANVCLNGR